MTEFESDKSPIVTEEPVPPPYQIPIVTEQPVPPPYQSSIAIGQPTPPAYGIPQSPLASNQTILTQV